MSVYDFWNEKYKTAVCMRPSDDVSPDEKSSPEWNLKWQNYIIYNHLNNTTAIRLSDYVTMDELRDYAEGRQNYTKYMDILLGPEPKDAQREGWMNCDFKTIFSPAPMIMSKLSGILEDIEHDVYVDSIDEDAQFEKSMRKERLMLKKQIKPELDAIYAQLGIQDEEEVLPENREELDLMADIGVAKLPYETFMEKCLGHTFDISNHPENKRNVLYDLMVYGKAMTMDEVNVAEQKVYERHIDLIENEPIIEYGSKPQYGAVVLYYTISEVIAETGMKWDDVVKLGQTYGNNFGNPAWHKAYSHQTLDKYTFGDWRIPVVYAAYKTVNKQYLKQKNGKTYRDSWGKISTGGKSETRIVEYQTVYNSYRVVNTDVIWGYGVMNDVPKPNMTDAEIPFHFYKVKGKSIVEQMKPILDDIQLAKLRYQNGVAQAPPPGLFIQDDAIDNIMYGNKKLDKTEVMAMFLQTGKLLYSRTAPGGNPNISQPIPITPYAGGANVVINDAVNSFSLAFNQLSQITGIDAVTLSQESSKQESVGGQKMAVASTNTVLKPIYAAYINIKESFARNAVSRIQTICVYNKDPQRGYGGVVGERGLEAIKEFGQNKQSRFGIRIFARPTAEERASVIQAGQLALQAGKNGSPGMEYSQYLFLMRCINMPGGLKYAEMKFASWEAKKKKEDDEIATRNLQMQTEGNIRLEQQKTQGEMEMKKFETDQDIRKMVVQAIIDGKMDKAKFDQELQKLGVQAGISNLEAQQSMQQQPTPIQ